MEGCCGDAGGQRRRHRCDGETGNCRREAGRAHGATASMKVGPKLFHGSTQPLLRCVVREAKSLPHFPEAAILEITENDRDAIEFTQGLHGQVEIVFNGAPDGIRGFVGHMGNGVLFARSTPVFRPRDMAGHVSGRLVQPTRQDDLGRQTPGLAGQQHKHLLRDIFRKGRIAQLTARRGMNEG